jgi:hypothetical protein
LLTDVQVPPPAPHIRRTKNLCRRSEIGGPIPIQKALVSNHESAQIP